MDLNTWLLVAFVLLMLWCCGGMMRMGKKKRPPNEDTRSEKTTDAVGEDKKDKASSDTDPTDKEK